MPAPAGCTRPNDAMTETTKALSITAFATLLLVAFMMGANHVAARFAFNHGVDVITAVSFRSAVTSTISLRRQKRHARPCFKVFMRANILGACQMRGASAR